MTTTKCDIAERGRNHSLKSSATHIGWHMEIVSTEHQLLTNFEVLEVLKERRSRTTPKTDLHDSMWIDKQVLRFLDQEPVNQLTAEAVSGFMEAQKTSNLELTDSERMQITNIIPSNPVELHLVVEEAAERIDEEATAALLEQISQHLGTAVPTEEDAVAEENAAMEV